MHELWNANANYKQNLNQKKYKLIAWRGQYRIDSGQESGLTTTEVNELNAARRRIKHHQH